MEQDKLRELLNDLAAINVERAKAYEHASQQNQLFDVELRATFALLANQSRQNNLILKLQLEKFTVKKGSKPVTLEKGELYQLWTGYGAAFDGNDKNAMLEASRNGEEALLQVYEKAQENTLKPEMRQILENQVKGIQSSLTVVNEILNLLVLEKEKSSYRRF